MTPEVSQAIEGIRSSYPDATFIVEEDGDGGVFVILETVNLGDRYVNPETWIGFQITYQYPNADVYPHFVRSDLARVDGRPLGEGTATASFQKRNAIQCSRKSNQLNPSVDTAVLKLAKVLEWLRKHD